MICSHCEKEVEEYAQKRDKICGQCYRRMMNNLSRGKKYVMYKDLTEEEKAQIDARIKSYHHKKVDNSVDKMIGTKISENVRIAEQEKLVDKDIEEAFAKKHYKMPKDFSSVKTTFEQLNILLSDYINIYAGAEEIFNKLENDYRHAKEYYATMYCKSNTSTAYALLEKRELWEERHNMILEKRRKIKNMMVEYNLIKDFLEAVNKNTLVKGAFLKALNGLRTTGEVVNNGEYKAEISNLVEDEAFCIGSKAPNPEPKETEKRYFVEVATLYKGSRSQFNRYVVASNAEEAKQKVFDFIESQPQKFKFVCNKKDTKVTEIITPIDTKYCI